MGPTAVGEGGEAGGGGWGSLAWAPAPDALPPQSCAHNVLAGVGRLRVLEAAAARPGLRLRRQAGVPLHGRRAVPRPQPVHPAHEGLVQGGAAAVGGAAGQGPRRGRGCAGAAVAPAVQGRRSAWAASASVHSREAQGAQCQRCKQQRLWRHGRCCRGGGTGAAHQGQLDAGTSGPGGSCQRTASPRVETRQGAPLNATSGDRRGDLGRAGDGAPSRAGTPSQGFASCTGDVLKGVTRRTRVNFKPAAMMEALMAERGKMVPPPIRSMQSSMHPHAHGASTLASIFPSHVHANARTAFCARNLSRARATGVHACITPPSPPMPLPLC